MKSCNRVLCIGGRMRKQVEVQTPLPNGGTTTEIKTVFESHENVFSLELSDKNWIDDLFDDEIPIPRWNAPAVVVTVKRIRVTVPSDFDKPSDWTAFVKRYAKDGVLTGYGETAYRSWKSLSENANKNANGFLVEIHNKWRIENGLTTNGNGSGNNGNDETVEHDLLFLIGGRNASGLLSDVDV